MTKKSLSIIILIALALLAFLGVYQIRGEGHFADLCVDKSRAEQIMSGRTCLEDMEPDIYFDEEKLFYDSEAGAFYYSLIQGSNSSFNPRVQVISDDRKMHVVFPEGSITKERIAASDTIDVLLYDEKSYCIRKLFCTTLPMINIEASEEIGDLDVRMNVTVFDNEKTSRQREISSEGFVRLRGNTTRIFPKKSFKLSLRTESVGGHARNNDISLLGMRKDDDWILTACYNDQDRVRNLLTHNLWTYSCGEDNAYGIQTGIEFKFVELFVNGQYWGLYIFGYKPDAKTMEVNILNEEEDIYIKRDYLLSGFRSDYSVKPIFDYYFKLEEQAKDNQYLKSIVDIDNIIDFNLFVTLIQGSDNILKNYYVLLLDQDDGRKGIYVPWDLDRSWGDEWTPDKENQTAYYDMPSDLNLFFTDDALWQLLYNNDEETWQRLFVKYDELRADGWSDEKVLGLIDEYEQQIFGSGAYLREINRWPYSDDNGENSLSTFRAFVKERLSEMDLFMDKLKTYRSDNPFINQSLGNKHLEESVIVIEIADNWVLGRDHYSEFLEYLGVDTAKIQDDTRFVVLNYGGDKAEYISDPGGEGAVCETAFGDLELSFSDRENYEFDEEYTVFLDGHKCFNTAYTGGDPIVVSCLYNDRATVMNMDEGYKIRFDMSFADDPQVVLSLLDNVGGNVLLQINNKDADFIDKERLLCQFDINYGSFGTKEAALAGSEQLVFLLDSFHKTGYLVENPYESGSTMSTELGDYAFYQGDDSYGMYINGVEVQVDSLENLYSNELSVTFFSKDWQECIREFDF